MALYIYSVKMQYVGHHNDIKIIYHCQLTTVYSINYSMVPGLKQLFPTKLDIIRNNKPCII